MKKALILWDIDGTLLQTLGAGIRGMNRSFERLHGGVGVLDGLPIAGRTDLSIVSDGFAKIGTEATPERVATLRDAYFEDLREEPTRPVAGFVGVLPGVWSALDAMAGRADLAVGLLTGNFAGGAEIKLGHFGLWERFPFGAYGDVHRDRRDLVPVAVDAAAALGIQAEEVVVIGDTPLDIDCAHAHDALAIAVATGPYSADQLAAADLTIGTLEELTLERLSDLRGERRGAGG